MGYVSSKLLLAIVLLIMMLTVQVAFCGNLDIGKGFIDHGIAAPVSNACGIVATVDGQGRDVVLIWLSDHRGGYELLMIDAETGKSEEYPMPFRADGDSPYASILSSANKYYTYFNGHFVEFDPAKRAFTFSQKTAPQMAMSMTEDNNGIIWAVSHPHSGIVSFDPKTRKLKDYGYVHKENWAQYPQSIAADDAGWIYFGIGSKASHLFSFDPHSGQAKPMISEAERGNGHGYVYRGINGKVYGQAVKGKTDWYEFYKGVGKRIGRGEPIQPKFYIAGTSGLTHNQFPDGKRLISCNTVDRILIIDDPKLGTRKRFTIDYKSDGARIMGMVAAPDGSICGGTAFPMRFFSYNPKSGQWLNRPAYEQWNTMVSQGNLVFVGGYGDGFLLQWDPARPWVETVKNSDKSNPQYLTDSKPSINRPYRLLATPDGKNLVLAGTPSYGYTGGGLLFWNLETKSKTLINHTSILPEQSTRSLVALQNTKLLAGTTTSPGTGGEKKAKEAEIYIMDMVSKRVEWHKAIIPGMQEYLDMCEGPDGLVYGFADRRRFFVFDPNRRKVLHEEDLLKKYGETVFQQGTRVFTKAADKEVYILFVKGIAKIDPKTYKITMLGQSPVPISIGGSFVDGRIYFGSGSHLCSYKVQR